jgi:hypothetical protein
MIEEASRTLTGSKVLYEQSNITNTPPEHQKLTAGIWQATVVSYNNETNELIIKIEESVFSAIKAFSLLLDPKPNDIVLCHAVNNDTIYATQILESGSETSRTITLPERISVMSSDDIEILAKGIEMNSREIQINAVKSVTTSQNIEMQTDVMSMQSRTHHEETGTRIVTSQTLKETVFRTANRHYGADQLTVDGSSSVTAQKYILNSKGTVQINGSKIDLG